MIPEEKCHTPINYSEPSSILFFRNILNPKPHTARRLRFALAPRRTFRAKAKRYARYSAKTKCNLKNSMSNYTPNFNSSLLQSSGTEFAVQYLYLKLGNGNCQAEYWLNQAEIRVGNENIPLENVFGKPAVTIFFGKTTTEDCRNLFKKKSSEYGKGEKPSYVDVQHQIKHFFDAGDNRNAKFVVIHAQLGKVYVCEPNSQVEDMTEEMMDKYDKHLKKLGINVNQKTEDEHYPKVIFVKDDFKTFDEVPNVLATLPCNNYLNRGTCREITLEKNWGAIQAIKYCLNEELDKPDDKKKLLSLLGWHELETLVFLILKNYGVHPSAWRGGTLPQVDIVAENYSSKEVIIKAKKPIEFKPKEFPLKERRQRFQIKRGKIDEDKLSKNADYFIALDYQGESDRILNAAWIVEQLEMKEQEYTKKWFKEAISWYLEPKGQESADFQTNSNQ